MDMKVTANRSSDVKPDFALEEVTPNNFNVVLNRDILIPTGGSISLRSGLQVSLREGESITVKQTKQAIDARVEVPAYELEQGNYSLDLLVKPLEDLQVTLKEGLSIAKVTLSTPFGKIAEPEPAIKPAPKKVDEDIDDDKFVDPDGAEETDNGDTPAPTKEEYMRLKKDDLVKKVVELQVSADLNDDDSYSQEELSKMTKDMLCDEIIEMTENAIDSAE